MAPTLTRPDPEASHSEQEKAVQELLTSLIGEMDKKFDERDNDLAQKIENLVNDALPQLAKQYLAENPNFSLPGAGEEKGQEFSFVRAATAIREKQPDYAPYEFECFRAMNEMYGDHVRTRAPGATDTSGALGQFLVPEEHFNEIINLFYANSVSFGLGARSMPNQFGELKIPVLKSGVSAAWLAENTAVSLGELLYTEHTMRPKQLMAATVLSNVLMTNSRPTAESIIRDNFSNQFRIALDTAILKGSGSGAEPIGIINDTPVASGMPSQGAVDMTGSGNNWSYAKAMEFQTDLANADALQGSLGWAMSPTDFSNAVQMPSGTASVDVNRLVISQGTQTFLLGYPIGQTTILSHSGSPVSGPEVTVIFGDWSQVRVPFWKTLELRASDVAEDTFLKNQTVVRGVLYADTSFDHLESFSLGTTDAI
jgi:HK97 family phage major capsid protein